MGMLKKKMELLNFLLKSPIRLPLLDLNQRPSD